MSWCLVTDLDGTLLGESSSTLELRDAIRRARAELSAGELRWVIATGRAIDDTKEGLLEAGLSLTDFDAFITSVGAELRFGPEDPADPSFFAHLSQSGFDAAAVRERLDALPAMRLQPEHEQLPHKVSYFVEESAQARQRVIDALADLPFSTRCVFCLDNYLDVAPSNGTKGGAVEFLRRHWGLTPDAVVAAGDSGNDLSMLQASWRAIVVGNGASQLRSLRAKPGVTFARAKYAAGVLEGLRALNLVD